MNFDILRRGGDKTGPFKKITTLIDLPEVKDLDIASVQSFMLQFLSCSIVPQS